MTANTGRAPLRLRDHVVVWLFGVVTGAAAVGVAVLVAVGAEVVAFAASALLLCAGVGMIGAALVQGARRGRRR